MSESAGFYVMTDEGLLPGATVPGPPGPAGPQGAAGSPGATGPAGADGATGPAGADSTVPGPEGPEGPAGPKGDTGATGGTGPQGTAGEDGSYWYAAAGGPGSFVSASPFPQAVNGDWYLNTNNGDIYQNDAGTWNQKGNIRGAQGVPGVKGDNGDIGPAGPAGADSTVPGPEGPAGTAATVTTGTTTTGAAGSSAAVTNSGTSSAAVLNFTIPQGAKGDTGDTGPAGTAPANVVTTDTDQTVTGVKTFGVGKLLMTNGTITAEPYSDVNAPQTFNLSEYVASVPTPPTGQTTIYTTDGMSLRVKNDAGTDWGVGAVQVPAFTATGDVAVFTGTQRYYFETAGTITVSRASLGTAGTTTTTVVVKKNGTTFSTLNLTNGLFTVTGAPNTAVAAGDYLTVDVTAAGTGAKDLVVTVRAVA